MFFRIPTDLPSLPVGRMIPAMPLWFAGAVLVVGGLLLSLWGVATLVTWCGGADWLGAKRRALAADTGLLLLGAGALLLAKLYD